MKALFSLLTILALSYTTQAQAILGSSKCSLDSAPRNAPDWQTQAFPLIRTSSGYEVAASMGSGQLVELTVIDPSQLAGWPTYNGGQYYAGGNDIWVLVRNGVSLKVIKPLETDPNNNQRPANYTCSKTM